MKNLPWIEIFSDTLIVVGAGSVAGGAWMIMPAAGLIVGGFLALVIGTILARP